MACSSCHGVQRGTVLEPFKLSLVECVIDLEAVGGVVRSFAVQSERLAGCKL